MKSTFTFFKAILCLTLIFSILPTAFSQVSRGGTPLSFQLGLADPVPSVTMPAIDRARLRAEDAVNDGTNTPYRFAYGFQVDLNLQNAGAWTELPGGDRVWRLRIDCPAALSVNLLYDDFYMPPGARYFLYRPDRQEILGAFGDHNNRDSRRFATALIHHESVILEYYEPAPVRGQGLLSVAQVAHGYRPLLKGENSEGLNDAGNCQVNVNCSPEGDDWQLEKKAVARLIMDGAFQCTGALINNTAQDCTPYFLTAHHCIDFSYDAVTNPDADNFVFYWNYERPGCPNTGSVPNETTVGAIVRANPNVGTASASSDFALLELTTNPGDFYDVYYTGFNATGDPGTGGVGIHHPAGDAKKIATHSITPGSVVSNRYWRIYWDQTPNGWSVTEGGSSGSPLINSDKQIIGQLFGGFLGGQPNCSDPANDEGDYGKLSYSWENAGATDNRRRLYDWLDPVGNGTIREIGGTAFPCNGCVLNATGLNIIGCDNNGTPNDVTDDRITFTLNPQGDNLGASYTVSGPGMTPATGAYGGPITFTTDPGTAGSGNLSLTIVDDTNAGCQLSFSLTDTGNCPGATCSIIDAGLVNLGCDDNGTPDNPNDDQIVFQLTVIGVSTGSTYSLSGDRLSSTNGLYGVTKTFFTSSGTAGGGDLEIVISDDENPGCTLTFLLADPGACSGAAGDCTLTDPGLGNVQCDDNGTPTDASDDLITFQLNPTGDNLGGAYTVSGVPVSPSSGNYGFATTFTAPAGSAGGGDLLLTLTDDGDPACSLVVLVADPGSCSDAVSCSLQTAGLSGVQCDDNGTPADALDDRITFSLDPQGDNLGSGYTILEPGFVPGGGSYGFSTAFTAPGSSAGAGDLTVTLVDDGDPNCTLLVTVPDPGSCSGAPACDLQSPGIVSVACNDNGTPADPGDDFLDFTLDPQGDDLGVSYTLSGVGINTQTGAYGGPAAFSSQPGTADGNDLLLTITDGSDPGCTLNFFLPDAGSCSDPGGGDDCGLDNVTCADLALPVSPDGIALLNPQDLLLYTGPPDADCDYNVYLVTPRSPIFDCGDLGPNLVTVRIVTADGAQVFCTATVTVTDPPGNCNEGESRNLSGLSQEDGPATGLRVFPVPARDYLQLEYERASVAGQLLMRDRLGRLVRQWRIPADSGSLTVATDGLPAGLYTLTCRVAERTLHRKVILTK